MSLKDALSTAIKGSDPDEAAAAALADLTTARDKLTAAQAKEVELKAAIAAAQPEVQRAADDADRKKWEAAKAKLAALQADLAFVLDQQRAHAKALHEAEVALHKARVHDRVKTAKRHANLRSKAAKKIEDGVALMFEGWNELHIDGDKLMLWGGYPLTQSLGGLGVLRSEIEDAVARELGRQSAPPPLDGRATPALPGARAGALDGDPKKFRPLVEVIAEANEYLLKRIETGPALSDETNETAHSAQLDQQSAPASGVETFDAVQVLASIKPQKLSV